MKVAEDDFDQKSDSEFESSEEEQEEEGAPKKKYDFKGWMKWTKAESMALAANADAEYRKRACYRLGMILQNENNFAEALLSLRKTKEIDP